MIAKIKYWWRIILHLTPMQVRHMFYRIHKFEDLDPELVGFKYAIFYGKLYFMRSDYDKDGVLDTRARAHMVDKVIRSYSRPEDYFEYLRLLKELRGGIYEANRLGFFSVGNDKAQNAVEAANYQKAIDSLNVLIPAVTIYPRLWKQIFLQPSEPSR